MSGWTAGLSAGAAGLGAGLGLIVAIGAQNAFVLRQGLRREHVGPVVAVCIASDILLITAGTAGLGALVTGVPWLLTWVRIIGAGFLFVLAVQAARRAWRPAALVPDATRPPVRVAAVLATALALTWLNPHVYLDTVILLGSLAAGHGGRRWWFAAGAGVASVVWFVALGFGARWLAPFFSRPTAWRALDVIIALVMAGVGISLLI